MSLLLMIPAEIRLAIFRWTICSLNTPPSHPAEEQSIRHNLRHTVGFTYRKIKHLRPPNHTLPLLLVNRQIYDEVKPLLCRLSADYYVDIMVLDIMAKESELWPTWSVPALPQTQYIDSINATLRIFDLVPPKPLDGALRPQSLSEIQLSHEETSIERGERLETTHANINRRKSPYLGIFYWLLVDIFYKGPGLLVPVRRPLPLPQYIVKKLVIDIQAPVETPTNESMAVGDSHCKSARKLLENDPDHDDAPMTPEESLARLLCEFFDRRLAFGPNGNKWGQLIYEQVVDSIVLTLNGKDLKVFELESRLREEEAKWRAEPPNLNYNATGKRLSEKWISWAYKRRQSMREGLKIDFNQKPYSGIQL
ncbi:unnamed protein product [Clonostachys chloroleuca]|uniref:Uncharacterized protein n=1 Tax=Clonostachys chloroleuca TaxID=1926264 RepID=A0AA35MCQ5_9HYPO|nr:unnamed protein product [Clonostachys chloroleuca]